MKFSVDNFVEDSKFIDKIQEIQSDLIDHILSDINLKRLCLAEEWLKEGYSYVFVSELIIDNNDISKSKFKYLTGNNLDVMRKTITMCKLKGNIYKRIIPKPIISIVE